MKRTSIIILLVSLICSIRDIEARINRVPDQFNSIQNAIDNTDNGDTVLVARNQYREHINFNGRSISVMSNFVFTGDEADIAQTIIDGSANEGSVVVIRTCQQAALSGFTITGGITDFGGAVYCRESNATFSHLVVENNVVDRNGAGIYCTRAGEVLIHDVIIRDNVAGYVGGGFSCYGGVDVTMRNVLIYDNECDHVGGALHAYRAELTLENVTVTNNHALHSGGAIYVTQAGLVHVSNSIFWENSPHEIYAMSGNDSTHIDVFFSLIDGGSEDVVDFDGIHVDWGVGNIDSDPIFVDVDRDNYQLAEDSPCIDAGHLEYEPDPDGTRSDIGAYNAHQDEGGTIVLNVPDDFDTIQEAIDNANDGDVVLVQPGEYFENLEMSSNITLGSRFIATGNAEFIESTVIDGDGETTVIIVREEIPNSLISGFTIQNGAIGGGIACLETNVTLANLLIRDNTARDGGGIYIRNFEEGEQGGNIGPSMRHVTIMNNEAQGYGGGIQIGQSEGNAETIIEDVVIIDNRAGDFGGGISMGPSNAILNNVVISNNSAGEGGGMHLMRSNPDITSVLIARNSSRSASAIKLWVSNPRLDNVTISSNRADENGQLILLGRESHLELTNSIIWGNEPSNLHSFHESNRTTILYSDVENGEEAITGQGEIEWGDGNINANPLFNNPDGEDFTLIDNSPCIDAGDPESDRDADGTVVDMGAFHKHQDFDYKRLFMVPDEFRTIQEAIDVTQYGDSILVRPGRYEENLNLSGHSIFIGSLYAITHDPTYIDSTIIDGGGNDVVVKYARGEGGTLTGFKIVNGRSREGGGIFTYNSSPNIEHCTITDNSSEDGGGGVFIYGGSPDFINCTISGNQADESAGGFHLESAAWTHVSSCIIWGNEPEEIAFNPDGDLVSIFMDYCAISNGEEGIITNFNGNVNWGEGNIAQNPQFIDGENADYHLTENSPCIDVGEPGTPVDPDGTPADIGAYYFDHGGDIVEFNIGLSAGWNVISSPVQPPNLSMETIFSGIIEDGNLAIVKSQEGRFFRPDQEFNNINGWDVRYGYWVKVDEADELIISNRLVQEDNPIPLDDGWSIVSYFPQQQIDVVVATMGIIDELIIVKDFQGRFYLPGHGFSNMHPLRQGLGYQLKVEEDIDLIWDTDGEELDQLYVEIEEQIGEPSHFSTVAATPYNMSILIPEATSTNGGAEIAAFNSTGLCVGASVLNQHGKTGLALWGDDPVTNSVEGLQSGERPVFKVWMDGREQIAEIEWTLGYGNYQTDGYAVGNLSFETGVPYEFALNPPYPNPFNSMVRLSFTLPEANRIRLSIYDIVGRLVSRDEQFYLEAGNYEITINAKKWSSGIYFAELKTKIEGIGGGLNPGNNNVKMRKMVLVK